ncbi:MAG TPA: DegT/DnrJ/EryC1/StrS family aminotransferase [Solirubrobacterales bacterium]|nr:DegT/DnrJ/EryC1/StrS family aminotransferase [Solirubrobacterales bacterium]
MSEPVPYLDLSALPRELEGELERTVARVAASGWYLLGPELEAFERDFASYCGARHCVGVASGMSAIELALLAGGIGPGDEVIVPAYTWIATWLAVTRTGATPVPVDAVASTYNIDVGLIPAAISERTAAIVPVHLRGEPADMDAVTAIAAEAIGEFCVIRQGAVLGDGVAILPHAIVDAGVEIGAATEVQARALLGRRPRAAGAIARDPVFEERLVIGAGCAIGVNAVLYYGVEIGGDTLIGDHASIREGARIGSGCVIGRASVVDREVRIGDRTVIMFTGVIASKSEVGKDVFIAPGVTTTNDNALGADGWVEEKTAGAAIEDEAKIGANSTLLPGVRIGRGAVVGAGSVVTRDVEPRTTVMGVPARSVGSR